MKRIYVVGSADPSIPTRLVLASTKNQALVYVAQQLLEVNVASQTNLVDLITKGVKVETTEENK